MLRVGLTGGIASGKTTVASFLRDSDCMVLQADPLAHELLEPGQESYDEVVGEFGAAILSPDGKVDRSKLGAIVFGDPAKLARLNAILHPRVLDIVRKWFTALDRPGGPQIAFLEAALIIEAGYHKELNKLVVCWCRPDQQIERLVERGLSPEEAKQRIAAQMPLDEKKKLADELIDCSGSVEETEEQAAKALERLQQATA
jgi:dephospho-CoA kinase